MTCRQIEELIDLTAAGAALPPEGEAHIAGCESCRRLLAALRRTPGGDGPSALRLDEIKAALRPNIAPVKPLPATGVLVAWLLAIAALAVGAGIVHFGTAGWQALGVPRRIAIYTILIASFGMLATMLARQMAPGSRVILRPPVAVGAILAIFAATFAILFQVHPEPAFVQTGLVCLSIGIGVACGVALVFWLILRRGLVLEPIAAGALTGLLAGVASLALLETFCPNPNQYHILAWHLGAVVVSTLCGAGAGKLVDRFGH